MADDIKDKPNSGQSARDDISVFGEGTSYGAARAVADIIGAPVDIVNTALSAVGLGSQRPFLGSSHLTEHLYDAIRFYQISIVPKVTGREYSAPTPEQRGVFETGMFTGNLAASVVGLAGITRYGAAGKGVVAADVSKSIIGQDAVIPAVIYSTTVAVTKTAQDSGAISRISTDTAPEKSTKPQTLTTDKGIIDILSNPNLRHAKDPTHFTKGGATSDIQNYITSRPEGRKFNNSHFLKDGDFGRRTARALNEVVIRELSPEKYSHFEQQDKDKILSRMRTLATELTTAEASPYHRDPRVTEFQAYGYALGVYKGSIDGLTGSQTRQAIELFRRDYH